MLQQPLSREQQNNTLNINHFTPKSEAFNKKFQTNGSLKEAPVYDFNSSEIPKTQITWFFWQPVSTVLLCLFWRILERKKWRKRWEREMGVLLVEKGEKQGRRENMWWDHMKKSLPTWWDFEGEEKKLKQHIYPYDLYCANILLVANMSLQENSTILSLLLLSYLFQSKQPKNIPIFYSFSLLSYFFPKLNKS